LDRNLALELVRATEAAALASARLLGKGDPIAADRAAAEAMALAISGIKITGNVIIGERDEIPDIVLRRGDVVGSGEEPEVDIALNPLEGMGSLADGQGNAISAIALAPRGSFRHFHSRHMRKIAVDREAADCIDLGCSVFDQLVRIAEAKRVYVEDLTVAILNRERHEGLIDEVRRTGARIELVRDGDLASAVAAAMPDTGIDVALGTGDTRQGIITAAALACLGGGFQGQLIRGGSGQADDECDYERVFGIEDLTGGKNIMFAVTGVSSLRSKSGTLRFLRTEHFFDKEPDYT